MISSPTASTASALYRADAGRLDAPVTSGAAERERQADALARDGGLQSPPVEPPPTQQELDALAARTAAADDDAAVGIANDPRALALLSPAQKAALVRKLMDGHTNGSEEQAIKKLLLSCRSRDEMDQVVQMSGGIQEIADELDAGDLREVCAHAEGLTAKQAVSAQAALDLLEQAQTPEEFERLYHKLGAEQLKHKLPAPPQPELLQRLDALGARYGIAGVGFGMPPEKTCALQATLQQAIDAGDNDTIVKLAENGDAMKAASPVQKAAMIRILQDGWTKDCQDMAIARILTSCDGKAEFDRVVDMAGGPAILDDVDLPEAKADINKVMGGFERVDCADDKATAAAYRGVLMPPQVDALSAARPPSEAELGAVLGAPPAGLDGDAAMRADGVRRRMGQAAHDLQGDALARNKLALVNRERQLHGQPPLDHTALVTRAYEVANDPAYLAQVQRTIAAEEKAHGPLDAEARQEVCEKVLAQRLGTVAKAYGLSEQDMKTLVTAKMGRILQEGAAAVRSLGDAPATRAWADRLQLTGATAANLFKVPPSFVEDFVNALSVIGDALAAVVNVIPGVGQAVSGAYFAVKAVVGLATGDILGAFKSLLSAVPGFSAVLGAAGAAINTGAKIAQAGIAAGEGIASGNPLAFAGAVGGMAGHVGIDLHKFVPGGAAVQGAIAHGAAVGGMVDGVARGDFTAVLGAALPGELRALGAHALAGQLEALGSSPAALALRDGLERLGPLVGAIGAGDAPAAAQALRKWLPQLGTHALSRGLDGLGGQALRLLESPALDQAHRHAPDLAEQVRRALQQLSALTARVGDVRRFEDAAAALRPLSSRDLTALAAQWIRRLGVQ